MTEADWLACEEPPKMLDFLRGSGQVSDRKLQLFGVACCRRVWRSLSDGRSRDAVEWAELFAEGRASAEELRAARIAAHDAHFLAATPVVFSKAAHAAAAAVMATNEDPALAMYYAVANRTAHAAEDKQAEEKVQASLLRDLFGALPFRRVRIEPAWLTPAVVTLAAAIYQE
jgi:hypothetical protein